MTADTYRKRTVPYKARPHTIWYFWKVTVDPALQSEDLFLEARFFALKRFSPKLEENGQSENRKVQPVPMFKFNVEKIYSQAVYSALNFLGLVTSKFRYIKFVKG